MSRRKRLVAAAMALSLALPLTTSRSVVAAADSFQVSSAILRSSEGTVVGKALVLCTSTFNYVAVHVVVSVSPFGAEADIAGSPVATINTAPIAAGPNDPPFNGSLYVYGYPTACPAAGSVITLIDHATHAPLGEGALTSLILGNG